jgi:hypothetical protein
MIYGQQCSAILFFRLPSPFDFIPEISSDFACSLRDGTGEGRRRGPERVGAWRVHGAAGAPGRCAGGH